MPATKNGSSPSCDHHAADIDVVEVHRTGFIDAAGEVGYNARNNELYDLLLVEVLVPPEAIPLCIVERRFDYVTVTVPR